LEETHIPDSRFPDFVVPRLQTAVLFEPTRPETPEAYTFSPKAFLDSATPYTVVPHTVHCSGHIKIYQDLGQRPYRVLSVSGEPLLQRFAEVGLRLRGPVLPEGKIDYLPESFVRVKAFLLEANVRPLGVVLVGLDTLLSHFVLHAEHENTTLDLRTTKKPA
jgi:hypothetical protein